MPAPSIRFAAFAAALLALSSASAQTGARGQVSAGDKVSDGTVKIGLNGEVNNLNPFSVNEIFQGDILGQIYSSLVRYDNKGNIIGDLAESYDASSDAKTWTFKLRSNVQWTSQILGGRFNSQADLTYSRNLNQGGTVDLNFSPTIYFRLPDEGNRK